MLREKVDQGCQLTAVHAHKYYEREAIILCAQVIISCQQKNIYIYNFSGLQGLRTEFFSVLIVIQRKHACVGMQHAQHETMQRSEAHFRREIQQTLSRTLDSELTFAEMENSKFLV